MAIGIDPTRLIPECSERRAFSSAQVKNWHGVSSAAVDRAIGGIQQAPCNNATLGAMEPRSQASGMRFS